MSLSGSFDERQIHDVNKPDESFIAGVSLSKLLPDLNNSGYASDFVGSGVAEQISRNSLHQSYEFVMGSKTKKQKS